MAGDVVASVVEKLGQLLLQETVFIAGVRGDVEWLRDQLRWMECFLKDADAKRMKGDERVKNWVRDVRELACQAEDTVDTFILQIESRRRRSPTTEFFRRYACCRCIPCDFTHLHQIGNEISQLRSKISSIRESREAYGIGALGENYPSSAAAIDEKLQARRQLSPHLDDDAVVVGFDSYKQFILQLLLDSTAPKRCVISIAGMGGLGKTTLASTVYNTGEVQSHFSVCAWFTVSQNYSASELLRSITKKVMGTFCSTENLETVDELKSRLHQFLRHTRYLIVFDDVWDQEFWEQIKAAFPNANNGSRVLFTTRLVDVAMSADPTVPPFELPFLSEQQSWELFLNKAFPSGRGGCPQELEELGRDLVKRCGGLPLALVVLGGLLSRKEPSYSSWLEVAKNMDWESTRDGKQCLQILALSYSHLPDHHLKSCFLYLGCFPEDCPVKAFELITLWIAEGFIPQDERQTMEDTANGYINELIQRCMVQVVDRSAITRRVKSVRVHDLVHDLCTSEAKEDGFFRICRNYSPVIDHEIAASRRLVICDRLFGDEFCRSVVCRVRTVLGFNSKSLSTMNLINILRSFKLLRVINLYCPPEVEFHNSTLPKEVSRLIHLRHITLRTLRLWHLPSSIGNLRNLQTLNVKETNISSLPKTLFMIQTLRHIRTRDAFPVHSSSIGNLRSLQTLKVVKAGSWLQRDLAKLSNLRRLAITQISVTEGTAISNSLPKLSYLTSLHLQAYDSTPAASLFTFLPSHHQHLSKLILDGSWTAVHQLPQSLISVSLINCELDRDAIDALERLPRVACLKLDACRLAEEEILCSRGGFPRLQNLQVKRMHNLKFWRIESGAMPTLTYLLIKNCLELTMLPDGLEHVASLKKLEMKGFQPDIMTRLGSRGEDRHKIQRLPSFQIDPTVGE